MTIANTKAIHALQRLFAPAAVPTAATRQIHLDALKVAAFALMMFDHLAMFAAWPYITRIPGRLVLPMFAVALAYKVANYSSGKALKRLTVYALISQPMVMPLGIYHLNILFTLAAGIAVGTATRQRLMFCLSILMGLHIIDLSTPWTHIEYGVPGVMTVALCVWAIKRPWLYLVAVLVITASYVGQPLGGVVASTALLIVAAYVHQETLFAWVARVPTHAWYALYPVHLLALWALVQLFI